ncbi:MAG TPA: cation diffusion facilitator family transporter [Myxococcota bacterium]|nr:cation diffusion facilitator family transporter [Myxococcota bacterium]
MAQSGSGGAIYTAIVANALITVAKFVGYLMSGSGSMLAEAIHSVADVGNQTLLAIGLSRASRPADEAYPDGYGREAFVWALISAVGIFFLGCGATVLHGLESLKNAEHHEMAGSGVAVGILLVSLLLEGWSGVVALRVTSAHARERGIGVLAHLRTTDDPFELAILLEDSAAMFGILVALSAIGLARFTGQTFWDPIGSILIGGLLGSVAVALIRLNRGLLVGRAVGQDERAKIADVLSSDPAIDAVGRLSATVQGTEAYAVKAGIDFNGHYLAEQVLAGRDLDAELASLRSGADLRAYLGDYSEVLLDVLGDQVDRIEGRVREAVRRAQHMDLEPERSER